jgi:uncharacterized membrane protein YraQ (UPF0718 family)
MKKIIDKIGGQWFFLIISIIIFLGFYLFNPNLGLNTLAKFYSLIVQILPEMAIVFGLIFIFNYFVDPKKIVQFLGQGSSFKGWFIAVISGIISTGPIYLWYPLLSDLKGRGMRNALISTFLYNRAVKLPLLALMISYFGLSFTIILNIYMIIFSIFNGYFTEKLVPGKE